MTAKGAVEQATGVAPLVKSLVAHEAQRAVERDFLAWARAERGNYRSAIVRRADMALRRRRFVRAMQAYEAFYGPREARRLALELHFTHKLEPPDPQADPAALGR